MERPFIIYALPRSRTAWLSHFLTYRDWRCLHEAAIGLREPYEIGMLLNFGKIGTVETAAAQGHWLVDHYVPNVRSVVVRRDVEDVIQSMLGIDLRGVAKYDVEKLRRVMEYGNRLLDDIARKPGVLTVDFDDLDKEEICASIFEFCLPYKFDREWWEKLRRENVQLEVLQVLFYYHANREAIDGFKSKCKSDLRRLYKAGEISRERA